MILLKLIPLLIFFNQKVYCTDEGDNADNVAETPIIPLVAAVQTTPSSNNATSITDTIEIVKSTENDNIINTTPETVTNITVDSTEQPLLNETSPTTELLAVTTQLNATERIISPIATCPAECKCAPSLVDAICTGRSLQDIPYGFSSSVKMLILTSNNIMEIGENCFKERNLFELMSLLMNHNRISILHPNAFVVLKHLEVLDLGDNRLTVLSPDLFVNNLALTILRLDNNTQLQIPESGALINAPALHDLNISSCNILFLPNDIFSGTPLLDTIDLSGNNLKELNPLILKSLPDLIKIILPKSFEPKSYEICLAHQKLEKIVISNKGDKENIECVKILSNISQQIAEIIVPPLITVDNKYLQNNNTAVLNNTTENIVKLVTNLSSGMASDKVLKLDANSDSGSPQNIQNDNVVLFDKQNIESIQRRTHDQGNENMEIRLPSQQSQSNPIEIRENKMSPPASQGLSGAQIDNIIIGILLTIITVTGAAIIINLNKQKIDAYFKKRQRRPPSSPANEFEIEPLKNVVANQ